VRRIGLDLAPQVTEVQVRHFDRTAVRLEAVGQDALGEALTLACRGDASKAPAAPPCETEHP
jgi:hypothetical protein